MNFQDLHERRLVAKKYNIRKNLFTTKQVKELITKAHEQHPLLGCLWHIGYLTGWRLRDLLHVKWSQIDLQKRILTSMGSLDNDTEQIYIPDGLLFLLKQLDKEKATDEEYLFLDWRKKKVKLMFWNRRLLDSVGLTDYVTREGYRFWLFNFYCLRRTSLVYKCLTGNSTERMETLILNDE